jgi:RNA polymerase sigma-70 factor (ECF subfamily)
MAGADPSLFVCLLLRHQNALLRYILPLVGNLDDAQDVLQQTALALWQKFDQYDAGRPFLPFARRFAHNEVLMHHRRKRRYTFLTEELIETLARRQEELELGAQQRRLALRSCVELLPETDRLLLEERYSASGKTIHQLAGETGQTANVLYKALARIRRQLLHCVSQKLALSQGI